MPSSTPRSASTGWAWRQSIPPRPSWLTWMKRSSATSITSWQSTRWPASFYSVLEDLSRPWSSYWSLRRLSSLWLKREPTGMLKLACSNKKTQHWRLSVKAAISRDLGWPIVPLFLHNHQIGTSSSKLMTQGRRNPPCRQLWWATMCLPSLCLKTWPWSKLILTISRVLLSRWSTRFKGSSNRSSPWAALSLILTRLCRVTISRTPAG